MSKEMFHGPFESPYSDTTNNRIPESQKKETYHRPIAEQISSYFSSIRSNLRFDYEAVNTAYQNENLVYPIVEVTDRAEHIVREAIDRNNAMAEIIGSDRYKSVLERERKMRGDCAVGNIICIDGRLTPLHTSGHIEGVHESMGGVLDTTQSKLTGNVELKPQTLERAIEDRPTQRASQILEEETAHAEITIHNNGTLTVESNCGAMKKFQAEAIERGKPFESDDLVAENFKLMTPAIEAMTHKYNTAAKFAGNPELDKVVIRTVYDTKTQGTLIGYGEKESPLFTTLLLSELENEISSDLTENPTLRQPGFYRQSFTEINKFLEKEEQTTNLVEYLLSNSTFKRSITEASQRLDELQGLTNEQVQALSFSLAKNMAFQWVTGLYKKELSEDHPFIAHHEKFQAITLDDGYDATVGRNDPEVQVFAANTATIPEAVDHIKTKIALMDHYADSKPYVIFISSGIAENSADDNDVRKQARTIVGRTFKGITQNDDIAKAVRAGILIPVPAIITSRSNRVIEIPNLLQ